MAVKPVEYNHQSSSADLQPATQGASKSDLKEVTLTASNANEVKKDEDQGFTETLDGAQKAFLDDNVDTDTITYTADEKKNTGKNQIDTKGTEKKNNSAAATAVTATAGALFGLSLLGGIDKINKALGLPDGFTALVVEIGILAAGAGSIVTASTFDSALKDREAQTQSAADNNAKIDNYNQTLQGNLTSMGEEVSKYQELSDMTQANGLDIVQQRTVLQIQYNDLMAQGNTKGAEDIKAQIDALNEGAATDPNADAMNTCKDNITTYQQNSAESAGVVESANTVSSFLQQGNTMKTWALINAGALALCALACALGAAKIFPKIAPFFPDIAGVSGAKILGYAAAAMFLISSGIMMKKAKTEGDAANAGDTMAGKSNDLNSQISTFDTNVGSASAGYTEADAKVAALIQQAQTNASQSLSAGKSNSNSNPNSNSNSDGTPNDDEKDKGAGAAA